MMSNDEVPIHIIVGAGASGLLLTNKLITRHKVLLVADGSKRPNDLVFNDPINWTKAALWSQKLPLTSLNSVNSSRKLSYCQAVGLIGGNTNVNAMLWSHGSLQVFDRYWPNRWNSVRMKALFAEVESIINPTKINSSGLFHAYLSSLRAEDESIEAYNSYLSTTSLVRDTSQRIDLFSLLEKHDHFDRLTVKGRTQALHLVLEGDVAVGVGVRNLDTLEEEVLRPSNGGEIVICAGVFETPIILQNTLNHYHIDSFTSLSPCADDKLRNDDHNTDQHSRLSYPFQDHYTLPIFFLGNWFKDPVCNEVSCHRKSKSLYYVYKRNVTHINF